jgi:dTDP-4-amino-4,6-dideoxygalactose transaminase
MLLWRHFPPVHGALPAGAVRAALAARQTAAADAARDRATAALAAIYPSRLVALLDSGTSALTLALSITARPNDRPVVALPAYACPDVGTAAIGAGFGIRLYDVEPQTLQPDLASLEAALRAGATHVVVTHLYGRLVDVAAVTPLAMAHGAVLVEDAAQHAGGTMRGVRGGALAPVSILSFGRGKGINAGGGGAMLWDAEQIPQRPTVTLPAQSPLKILVSAVLVDRLSSPLLYRLPTLLPGLGLGETAYHAPRPPAHMSGVSAALLSLALRDEPTVLAGRQAAEQSYHDALDDVPELLCTRHLEGTSGALRCPARLPAQLGAELAAFGVARSYPRTLAAYPEIAAGIRGERVWPGAAELAARMHTLPTHALLNQSRREELIRRLRD